MKKGLITIDGPAGAGKTSISRALANALGYTYVDTGALYRAVGLLAFRAGISVEDEAALEALLAGLQFEFINQDGDFQLYVNGENVSPLLRSPEMSMQASLVSRQPVVRKHLLAVQRRMGAAKGVVFEGRDMGTVVFPDADIKFYLDARIEVRARRRHTETAATGQSRQSVQEDMAQRDQQDRERPLAPLKPAPDAILIDTSDMDFETVLTALKTKISEDAIP